MESVRLQKLSQVIRAQDTKIEGLKEIMGKEQSRYDAKMENYAKGVQDRAAQIRSLKHDFDTDVSRQPAPNSIFSDIVASLRDERTNEILYQLPTQTAMEIGRNARTENVQRIIDILV